MAVQALVAEAEGRAEITAEQRALPDVDVVDAAEDVSRSGEAIPKS